MKKIFWGLTLLVFFINSHSAKSEEQVTQLYCMHSESYQPRGPYIDLLDNKGCSYFSEKSILIDKELWQKLRDDSNVSDQESLKYNKNIYQVFLNKKREELEKAYTKDCEEGVFKKGFKKATPEYNSCLNKQEELSLNKKKKEKNIADEKKYTEQKKLETVMANMKPDERRAYICEKTYGFKKGSDKFSDCIFKIMNAEMELERMDLQKKLAAAQLETAKANASRNSAPNYDPNVAAVMERANEIERGKILLNLSQALRTPPASPQVIHPSQPLNCRLNPINNRINCY